jgi:asparagine synthase (glutamine-hydrolysing)
MPEAFLFGSEAKAILAHPAARAELDPQALAQVFSFWTPLAPRTCLRGIEELPPGHSAWVEADGRLRSWAHWRLEFPARGEAVEADAERSARRIEELLLDAVRLRLRSDVEVGTYLSGGLDSTLVTALGQRLAGGRLRSFSVAFDNPALDERAFQEEASAALGTRHEALRCAAGDVGRVFPRVVWHAEKPIVRAAPAPLFLLSARVCERGLKVVLTGEGADEVFGGYDIFREAKVRRFWARQSASRCRPRLLGRLYPYLPELRSQPPAYLQAFFKVAPEALADPCFSHLPRWELGARNLLFLSAELKAALRGYDPREELAARLPERFRLWHPLSQAQWLETAILLPGYILSSQGDRVSMGNAVEGRFPFLDHRVVEYAAALAPALKICGLNEKFVLKRAAAPWIPAAIARRPKQPYRAPDAESILPPSGQAPPRWVEQALSPAALARSGLFDPAAVGRLIEKARRGQAGGARDNMAVVGIASAQLFYAQFIEGRGEPPSHEIPA